MGSAEDRLLTPGEVARIFRIDVKGVARAARQGRITRIRTFGGHGRYRVSEIRQKLMDDGVEDPDSLIPPPPPTKSAKKPANRKRPTRVAPGTVPAERGPRAR